MNRREVLSRTLSAGAAGGLVTLAGCSTGDEGDGGGDGGGDGNGGSDGDGGSSGDGIEETNPTGSDTTSASTSSTPTTTDGELDLREANVTGVAVERRSGREYRFDVTLYHDDEGEDGYANWWQVETGDGDRLGRRELLHAHGTREFTRSETIEVPDGVDCVVVRGHDQTHSYGGRAALVRVSTGGVRFIEQGPEPDSMAGEDCP